MIEDGEPKSGVSFINWLLLIGWLFIKKSFWVQNFTEWFLGSTNSNLWFIFQNVVLGLFSEKTSLSTSPTDITLMMMLCLYYAQSYETIPLFDIIVELNDRTIVLVDKICATSTSVVLFSKIEKDIRAGRSVLKIIKTWPHDKHYTKRTVIRNIFETVSYYIIVFQ